MKKIIICSLIIMIMLSLTSCYKKNSVEEQKENNIESNNNEVSKHDNIEYCGIMVIEKRMSDEDGKAHLQKMIGLKDSKYDIQGITTNYLGLDDIITNYQTYAVISFKKEMLKSIIDELTNNDYHLYGEDKNDRSIEQYNSQLFVGNVTADKLFVKEFNKNDEKFSPVMDNIESVEGIAEIFHENLHETSDKYSDNEYTAVIKYTEICKGTVIHKDYINEEGQLSGELEITPFSE